MNKRVAFAVLVLLVLTSGAAAQVKSTLELFDQSLSAELEKLYFVPEINRNYQLVFTVSGYGDSTKSKAERIAAGFLVSLIKKSAEKNKLSYSITKGPGATEIQPPYNRIRLSINKMLVSYPGFVKRKFLGEKTIKRKITADITAVISLSDSISYTPSMIFAERTDEIDYDELPNVETPDYPFTTAEPPALSEFETVIFPAILVLISAAAIVLFFTIRSK